MGSEKRERQRANRQARLEAAQTAQKRSQQRRQVFRIGLIVVIVLVGAAIFWFVNRDDDPEETAAGDTSTTTEVADDADADDPAETTETSAAGDDGNAGDDGSADEGGASPPAGTELPGRVIEGPTPCPEPEGEERVAQFSEPPPMCIDPDEDYTAVFDTSAGEIVVDLDAEDRPETVNNFVVLARYKYYDGTKLFRTDPSIGIIQGGGLTNTASPGYTIPDEGDGFTYRPGQLIMARTAAPDSAGGQFFFAVNDNVSALDAQGTYVPFGDAGSVESGMDVLEAILDSHEDQPDNPLGGAPDPEVTVRTVRIQES